MKWQKKKEKEEEVERGCVNQREGACFTWEERQKKQGERNREGREGKKSQVTAGGRRKKEKKRGGRGGSGGPVVGWGAGIQGNGLFLIIQTSTHIHGRGPHMAP